MPDQTTSKPIHKVNALINEKSPYLLQHAYNPVNWYPWGDEAFNKAQKENKPIFLSIGYSTCHWCHVMERESFEDPEIAAFLNKNYIAIKVDREERPDIDQVYMNAVVSISGAGGWPMSVFLTPDLKPFFGGTYFPREAFLNVLTRTQYIWMNNKETLLKSGQEMYEHLKKLNTTSVEGAELTRKILDDAFFSLAAKFDATYGGFGSAPKFHPSKQLRFLMRYFYSAHKKEALEITETTLRNMSRGGIYDHIGGGFHRYASDEKWLVPHFEKMLYDNANLALTYTEAYQITKMEEYALVAKEVLNYVLWEMTDKAGGFYSAQDADSEGKEGTFYIWEEKEIKKILDDNQAKLIIDMYSITEKGNFEGKNILHLNSAHTWQAKYTDEAVKARVKLVNHREKRSHPFKDDKIITAWNGLMIDAMAKASQVFDDTPYLQAAQKAARFIQYHLYKDNKLKRRFRDGEALHQANLDDYAYLIQALITLYESTFNEEWINWAQELQKTQDLLFWDIKEGGYFFSGEAKKDVIVRNKDFFDGARPNPNAVSALNLLRLYHLTYNELYKTKVKNLFDASSPHIARAPEGCAQMLIALDFYLDNTKEVALVSKNTLPRELMNILYKEFIPNKVIALKKAGQSSTLGLVKDKKLMHDDFTAFICEKGTCKAPSNTLSVIKKLVLPAQ